MSRLCVYVCQHQCSARDWWYVYAWHRGVCVLQWHVHVLMCHAASRRGQIDD